MHVQVINSKPTTQYNTIGTGELSDFKTSGLTAFFLPVDAASIILFRIFFGAILFVESVVYLAGDLVGEYWVKPKYHFTYWPFDFLTPLPGNGMYWLEAALGLAALCIALGAFYRIATLFFFFGFAYTFLLEQARYLNHFYLVILISFLMIFIPANRSFSIDSWRNKSRWTDAIPAWCLWLLRFTIAAPYFFGGIAKINSDWLQGQPLRIWLARDRDIPLIGQFLADDSMIYAISYSGLLLDLFIVPFLLFKRTRVPAFITGLLFHLLNATLFEIGIFPWFMIVATSLFFRPDWPKRAVAYLYRNTSKNQSKPSSNVSGITPVSKWQTSILVCLGLWGIVQVCLPLRHFAIPGNVHWTEEGHKYAWQMKLRTKQSETYFIVRDKTTGVDRIVNPIDYLESWQIRKMGGWPTMIWQFAQILKEDYRKRGHEVAVYANARVSLNGRQYQHLVDTTVDLTTARRPCFGPVSWILPLREPLDPKASVSGDGQE